MEAHPQLPSPQPEPGALAPRQRHREVAPAGPYVDVPYYGSDPNGELETGGLVEYWRILRRRKGTLILIAFPGALTGFLSTVPQTPLYQAPTSVEILGLNDDFLNIKQVNPVAQTGTFSETSDIQTHIRI